MQARPRSFRPETMLRRLHDDNDDNNNNNNDNNNNKDINNNNNDNNDNTNDNNDNNDRLPNAVKPPPPGAEALCYEAQMYKGAHLSNYPTI